MGKRIFNIHLPILPLMRPPLRYASWTRATLLRCYAYTPSEGKTTTADRIRVRERNVRIRMGETAIRIRIVARTTHSTASGVVII